MSTLSTPGWAPVDPALDNAIVTIATALLPDGFDACPDAPSNYQQLVDWLDAGRRMRVWNGASEHTIFGSPTINHHFRAWHDLLHWCHRLPFTICGEAAVAVRQANELARHAPNEETARRWRALIYAEVIGQTLYSDLLGEFPGNQRLFARQFLDLLLELQATAPGQRRQAPEFASAIVKATEEIIP